MSATAEIDRKTAETEIQVTLGLDGDVRADLTGTCFFLGGGSGQVDGVGAGLIGFPDALAERAHVK